MREKVTDALLGAIIKTIEELEALVSMLGAFGDDKGDTPRRLSLASELREISNLLDKLPLLANDLVVIKRRMRGLLSTDPDKTPRAVSVRDFVALPPETDTRFEAVEDRERRIESRSQTHRGLGVTKPPLPKKS
jgi:hypothetical protein